MRARSAPRQRIGRIFQTSGSYADQPITRTVLPNALLGEALPADFLLPAGREAQIEWVQP